MRAKYVLLLLTLSDLWKATYATLLPSYFIIISFITHKPKLLVPKHVEEFCECFLFSPLLNHRNLNFLCFSTSLMWLPPPPGVRAHSCCAVGEDFAYFLLFSHSFISHSARFVKVRTSRRRYFHTFACNNISCNNKTQHFLLLLKLLVS